MKGGFLTIICALLLLYSTTAQTLQLKNWVFQIQNDTKTYPTEIPSTLTTDLVKVGLISSQPYSRDNFLEYYKYETKNVNYSTNFTAPASAQGAVVNQIVFEGLDTHCSVFLNGKVILSAHNMFRRWVVNVTNLTDVNNLTVFFYSSAVYDMKRQKDFFNEFGFNLPANFSFTRKPAYQYGWDWGPRILTVGIWKQAYVVFGYPFSINNLRVQLTSPITTKFPTELNFLIRSQITQLQSGIGYTVRLAIQQNNQTIISGSYPYTAVNGSISVDRQFKINQNNVKNVSKLVWWTWDLGEPNLFNLSLTIEQPGKPLLTVSKTVRTGFRTVTVKQQKDYIGTSFTVNLNGYDVYMRGGNYIPPRMSMDKVPIQQYLKIKKYALFARYNMIRVWGGGQFEHQQFYQTMDQSGILIWHDLMFACALYPIFPSSNDQENIRMQMQDNLYRIGHHPSIGIWNGNNEVYIGWQEWGWKKGLDQQQVYAVEDMYKKIFKQILPQVIMRITPDIFYWQTSPSSSSSQTSTIGSGDIHFWRVWGGGTAIQQYELYVGRFNSEYGMQSMPQLSSIIKFTNQADRVPESLILRLHQRHPLGDKYLPMYTNKYAGTTTVLKKYAYYSQVMQAYALQMAIGSLRGHKPICMGSLYWQLNDVWPVSSWATVDYYGAYKIAHYRVRQMYNQLLVSVVHLPIVNGSAQTIKVVAVNDYDKKINLFVVIKLMDINGTVYESQQIQKTVNPFQNLLLYRYPNPSAITCKQRKFINVVARDPQTNTTYTYNYFFLAPLYRNNSYDPNLSIKTQGSKMTISTIYLANYVWIRSKKEEVALNLEENYFDIAPGQNKTVELPPNVSILDVEVSCYQLEIIRPNSDHTPYIRVQNQ